MKVDLGTTDRGPDGFDRYVDIVENSHIPEDRFIQADLRERWPFEDSSVDLLRAFDLIEHLPNRIYTMNEAWRVLKPGGIFHVLVPTTEGAGAWCDPTHVSFWNRVTFEYFVDGRDSNKRFAHHYGIQAKFRVKKEVRTERRLEFSSGNLKVPYLEIELAAVKPRGAHVAQGTK